MELCPAPGSAASEVQAELEQVLAQACSALQLQEEGRLQEAVQGYFLARSRIHFVAEALLQPLVEERPGDSELAAAAAACSLLGDTYTEAIERLARGCGSGTMGNGSCEPGGEFWEAGKDGTQLGAAGGMRYAGAGVLEARRASQAAAAGSRQQSTRHLPQVAHRCLREVQGSLDEVVGLTAIKQELREAVLLPMSYPQLFTGIRRPQCNLLFHGAPGTGKTMLVEKLAAEAGTPLLCLSPSAVLSKWAGESEQAIRGVFEAAAALSPALVFIDEVDSLAPARASGDDLAARRVLTELLIQMTAVTSRVGCMVFVLAATNRPQDCDPALLRRFDRRIEVPAPDAEARTAFFLAAVQRPELASHLSEEELGQLAATTEGYTGSDLSVLCREAAMAPLRELVAAGGLRHGPMRAAGVGAAAVVLRPVMHADFVAAADKIRPAAQELAQAAAS